tara:strand:+ start:1009 stop:2832 length:1824 start_codon:yes stop_codon:yes gene_type:complete
MNAAAIGTFESPLCVAMCHTETVVIDTAAPSADGADDAAAQNEVLVQVCPMVPSPSGGMAVAVKLYDVMRCCGDADKTLRTKSTVGRAKQRIKQMPLRIVYIKIVGSPAGGSPAAYVFLDGCAALLLSSLAFPHANCVLRRVHEGIEKLNTDADDNDPNDDPHARGGAISCVVRRVVAWCTSLTAWRSFLRHLLGHLSDEQLAFMQAWLIGFRSALSTPASELAITIREGTPTQAKKARDMLRERALEGWALLSEKLALSKRACAQAKERAKAESIWERAYAEAEAQAMQLRVAELVQDCGCDEEEVQLTRADRQEIHAVAHKAASDAYAKEKARIIQYQERADMHRVDIVMEQHPEDEAGSWLNKAVIGKLFANQNDDEDTMALLSAMFHDRRDTLLSLTHRVACAEYEMAVLFELRRRFEPLAETATVNTQLAAGFGARFTDTVLKSFWGDAASVYELKSIFANETKVRAVIAKAKSQYAPHSTPTESPADTPLRWAELETAGVTYDPLPVLQRHVDSPSVAPLVDVDDDDPNDTVWVKGFIDGRKDGKLMRCLFTVCIMNIPNVCASRTVHSSRAHGHGAWAHLVQYTAPAPASYRALVPCTRP